MNEQQFRERIWADPDDQGVDLLDAARASAELEAERQAARDFNRSLRSALQAATPPPGLRERLLRIPEQAANDGGFLRRMLPVAAVLLLAIALGLYYQPEMNAALTGDILGHIYKEEPYFGDGATVPRGDVDAAMLPVMGRGLTSDADGFEVTFAKDCYIARKAAMHLVVRGETGPVNLMMIPEQLVEDEYRIADERFNGLVTPASGGTLVVVGSKQEPITEYRDRLASSLGWEY